MLRLCFPAIYVMFLVVLSLYEPPVFRLQQPHEKCTLNDYTSGEWVKTHTPIIPGGYEYCAIDSRQDCRLYSGERYYLAKEFVPYKTHCRIREFAPPDVKACLTNRKIIFIGDSLARNQQQSLQCMALEAPEEKLDFVDGYKQEYDSYFLQYNASIHFTHAPFLRNFSDTIKHLDIDPRDIIVVGTGPWWEHIELLG